MAEGLCPNIQNSDFYGLGIRLGVYTQLISTLLSNHLLPKELGAAWDANFVFLAALLTATIKSVASSQPLLPVEIFVLLQLMLAFPLAVFSASGSTAIAVVENAAAGADGYWTESAENAFSAATATALVKAHEDFSPMGKFLRRVLVTAIAVFNTWFWFSGFHNSTGIETLCNEHVFLFASVRVDGPAAIVFQIFSALYLTYKTLLPLLNAVSRILKNIRARKRKQKQKVTNTDTQPDFRRTLLGFVAPPSVAIEKCGIVSSEHKLKQWSQQSKDRVYRSKMSKLIHFYGHVITLSISAMIIVYSILSIELTLAWNKFEGVYEASSAGQFLPLFIGLATLARTIILIFVEYMARLVKMRKKMDRLDDTAVWKYRLSPHSEAIFSAKPIMRRRSFDQRLETQDLMPKRSSRRELQKFDRLAAVLPVEVKTANSWLEDQPETQRVVVRPGTGRFMYQSHNGAQYVFHQYCPKRRNSISEGFTHSLKMPWPHRARPHINIPLKEKETIEKKEFERTQWYELERGRQYEKQMGRLPKAKRTFRFTRTQSEGRSSRQRGRLTTSKPGRRSSSSDRGIRWWYQAPRVNVESAFSSAEHLPIFNSMHRRWSFDDLNAARRFADELPSLQRSSRQSSSTRSSSTDSFSSNSSSTGSNTDSTTDGRSIQEHPRKNKRRMTFTMFKVLFILFIFMTYVMRLIIAIFNTLCCCSPLVAVSIHFKREWRRWRLKSRLVDEEKGRTDEPHLSYRCYTCPECDEDFATQKQTRQGRWEYEKKPPLSTSLKAPFGLTSLLRWSTSLIYPFNLLKDIGRRMNGRKFYRDAKQDLAFRYGDQLESVVPAKKDSTKASSRGKNAGKLSGSTLPR